MIKTVLFDVDGTILDTEFVMIKSLQKTLKRREKLGRSRRKFRVYLRYTR